jgi:predicted RNA methylase
VTVDGVPPWVDASRLLGPEFSATDSAGWTASVPVDRAAEVDARLRGVGLGGSKLVVEVKPRLPRDAVRAARLADARARRATTPGFSRPGCLLDEEGRYSLTPEALALDLGIAAAGRRILDATCGCGGNTIGFARAGSEVIAVDVDAARIAMARHNASIYGVAGRISFRRERAEDQPFGDVDLVFVDPPWGREWPKERCTLADLPVLASILATVPPALEVWAKVPPSFDPESLPGFSAEACFGETSGDRHRVKFTLLRGHPPCQSSRAVPSVASRP